MNAVEEYRKRSQLRAEGLLLGRADWCPTTGQHIHRFSDYGSWVDHRHPKCDYCGYVDETRTLPGK